MNSPPPPYPVLVDSAVRAFGRALGETFDSSWYVAQGRAMPTVDARRIILERSFVSPMEPDLSWQLPASGGAVEGLALAVALQDGGPTWNRLARVVAALRGEDDETAALVRQVWLEFDHGGDAPSIFFDSESNGQGGLHGGDLQGMLRDRLSRILAQDDVGNDAIASISKLARLLPERSQIFTFGLMVGRDASRGSFRIGLRRVPLGVVDVLLSNLAVPHAAPGTSVASVLGMPATAEVMLQLEAGPKGFSSRVGVEIPGFLPGYVQRTVVEARLRAWEEKLREVLACRRGLAAATLAWTFGAEPGMLRYPSHFKAMFDERGWVDFKGYYFATTTATPS